MNSINGITGIGTTIDPSGKTVPTTDNTINPKSLGEDQFLMLLVTELKNQDPLQPMQNSEFIAQLATFSSLEKLISIEALLKKSLGLQSDVAEKTKTEG